MFLYARFHEANTSLIRSGWDGRYVAVSAAEEMLCKRVAQRA
jgi:hypothetical protein